MNQTKITNYFNLKLKDKNNKQQDKNNKQQDKNNKQQDKNNKQQDKNNKIYILRFDGASKGNPGKSGAGAVLYENGKEIWNISRYLGIRTNNYAECFAMVLGIQEAFIRKINELHVEGDSLLIINQLKGKWKINNKDLKTMHLSIIQMIKSFNIITFTHIYRNYNNRADELANLCIK